MPKIYSTLSNDRSFPLYQAGAKDEQGVRRRRYDSAILIKGGANVADKHMNTNGVVETDVTKEQLEFLEQNASFKRLVERGFLSLTKPKDTKRDGAAPRTEQELKDAAGRKDLKVLTNTAQPE